MRILLLALLCAAFALPAHADGGRAFPPDFCSEASPFMSFTALDGANTECRSGQDVLKNALPNCTPGQQVSFDGSGFTCENKPDVPACATNEVLTYTGNSYLCVKRTDSVPTCATGQYLTYNGSTYQCVSVTVPALPVCGAGQVVTSDGTQLTCVNGEGSAAKSCTAYPVTLHYGGGGDESVNVVADGCISKINSAKAKYQAYFGFNYADIGSATSYPSGASVTQWSGCVSRTDPNDPTISYGVEQHYSCGSDGNWY